MANLSEQSANAVSGNRIAFVLEREIGIGAPDKKGCSSQDNVELGIDGAIGLESDGPDDDDDDGDSDFHQRCDGVRATVLKKHVMEMRLVSLEGGIALGNAAEHDAKGIAYGYCKNGESQGYEAQLLG